jgi:hypothetical protein
MKMFPGAGYWLQPERAAGVNQELVAFLESL